MYRRTFLLCIVLGLLALSSLLVVPLRALALTATKTVTPSLTPFPQANFVGTPISGTVPLSVDFTHLYTSTSSPILNCTWAFGDGTSQSVNGSFTTCPTINHVYTTTGNFTVRLSVTITDIVISATKTNYISVMPVGGWTPTRTRTPGCGGVFVVTSTPSPVFTPTAPTPTKTSTACGGIIFITATPEAPTSTPTPTVTQSGALPDLIVLSITEFIVPNPTATLRAGGCTSTPTGTRYVSVRFQNVGAGDAGTFVVDLNGVQQMVSGLAAGQISSVSFLAPFTTRTATVDATNLVAETDESNNSLTVIITPGPTTTGTVPPTICRTFTPTQTTATWTPTITITVTPSPTARTITPSGPTRTPTRTPTPTGPTPTPTAGTGVCSPVTSVITSIPFVFDGAGTFCWQASSLGGFINSWNTNSVSVNGQNVTNIWIGAGSYPAKINGFYYVSYNSSFTWGHFEARP